MCFHIYDIVPFRPNGVAAQYIIALAVFVLAYQVYVVLNSNIVCTVCYLYAVSFVCCVYMFVVGLLSALMQHISQWSCFEIRAALRTVLSVVVVGPALLSNPQRVDLHKNIKFNKHAHTHTRLMALCPGLPR